jgi:hypothetical protein
MIRFIQVLLNVSMMNIFECLYSLFDISHSPAFQNVQGSINIVLRRFVDYPWSELIFVLSEVFSGRQVAIKTSTEDLSLLCLCLLRCSLILGPGFSMDER